MLYIIHVVVATVHGYRLLHDNLNRFSLILLYATLVCRTVKYRRLILSDD